jgi:hypothetical protein
MLDNKELDAAIERQAIERNARKASKITGNRMNGAVEYLKG